MLFCVLSTLFAFFCVAYFLLDLQLIRGLRKLKTRVENRPSETPFITVLIAARNEEHNLPRVLNALLAQDYPTQKIQIIVVNDRSEDGTEKVLWDFVSRHSSRIEHLNVTDVQPGMSPKKHALLKGLEIAHGEWIAVTDADCVMGSQWLSTLSREFSDNTGMVLGFTAYATPATAGIGHGTQALEFASYGIISAGLVGLGFPIISNANNLAYRRKAFDEAESFRKHGHIVSGDDDFVLQSIHATGNWGIRYCAEPEALVRTTPPDSWNHFWEQRKRWASKTLLYGSKQVGFLAVVFAFYASIPVLMLAGFCDIRWFQLGLAVFAAKTFSDLLVMMQGLNLFKLPGLLGYFPFTALLHIPLILAAVMVGTLKGFTWKGQQLRRRI